MKFLFALCFFLTSLCASAQQSDILGISLGELHNDPNHFLPSSISGISSSSPIGWSKAASMGAGYARFDIPWSSMEWRPAGVYALNAEKSYWITQAHANGLKVCVIVEAGGSGVLSPPADVYPNPFDPTGFSNACAWLAKTYLTAGDVIEVLNEPNNGYPGFSGATATTAAEQSLVTFTSATTAAVHAAAPGIRVIGLGAQGGEIIAMLGMAPSIDGVVYHPYSNGSNNWPDTTYEPPYLDYEQWLAAIQAALPGGVEIWETEFAENNGSDAYVRASWLTRRCLMSLHAGIKHWFPHGLVFNSTNGQQFLEWNGLDSKMSYYAIQRLFVSGGLFDGVVTPVSTTPTITGADITKTVKGYVFNGNGVTICGYFYSGNNLNGYLSSEVTPITVSFPTTLTNVNGSYEMNLVSGDTFAIKATVSNGVATVTGAGISCEATVVVLAPGASTGPLTYNTWLGHLKWGALEKYAGAGPTQSILNWISANPITPDPAQ